MKVTFKYNIGTYSGTLNGMTYCSFRDGNMCIGRQWVKPSETAQQTSLAAISRNLSIVYKEASTAWKADLKSYAAKYGKEHVGKKDLPPTSYALYMKMMYSFRDYDSENVDLATLAFSDLETLAAPILTIKDAIDAGLLPNVSNGTSLTAHI